MSLQTFNLEIHDEPDVLVRIMQIIHRRGGRIRLLRVEPGRPWAEVHISADQVETPTQIAKSLEKLVDVRRVHIVTT
jgi:acetolactate synthase regulatory subunit